MKLLQSLLLMEDTSFHELTPAEQDKVTAEWSAFVEKIRSSCQQYLGVVEDGRVLLRGSYDYSLKPDGAVHQVRRDRYPSAVSQEVTDAVNAVMADRAGFKPRTQGLFVTYSGDQASAYGKTYLVFPIGDFSIAYISGVRDLYSLMSGYMSADERDNVELNSSLRKAVFELFNLNPADYEDMHTATLIGQIYSSNRASPSSRTELQTKVMDAGGMDQAFADLFTMWIPDQMGVTHNALPDLDHVELMMDCVEGFYVAPKRDIIEIYGDVDSFLQEIKK